MHPAEPRIQKPCVPLFRILRMVIALIPVPVDLADRVLPRQLDRHPRSLRPLLVPQEQDRRLPVHVPRGVAAHTVVQRLALAHDLAAALRHHDAQAAHGKLIFPAQLLVALRIGRGCGLILPDLQQLSRRVVPFPQIFRHGHRRLCQVIAQLARHAQIVHPQLHARLAPGVSRRLLQLHAGRLRALLARFRHPSPAELPAEMDVHVRRQLRRGPPPASQRLKVSTRLQPCARLLLAHPQEVCRVARTPVQDPRVFHAAHNKLCHRVPEAELHGHFDLWPHRVGCQIGHSPLHRLVPVLRKLIAHPVLDLAVAPRLRLAQRIRADHGIVALIARPAHHVRLKRL